MKGLWAQLIAATTLCGVVRSATLTVNTDGGNASSPILYGLMFEDINNSGDGGVYGQLLQNNGFQPHGNSLTAYAAVGDATISNDASNPLTSAISSSLKVSGGSGTVGFSNSGYSGIPVNQDTYTVYMYVKGTYSGCLDIALVGLDGTIYGSSKVDVTSNSSSFTYVQTSFDTTQSNSANNTFQVTYDAASATDGGLNFALPQLFPVTYHQRYNGLRNDIATFMQDIGGSFLRFPGGNNLEGNSIAERWAWNQTIGPVTDRPGRMGTWGYPNTDGLGLMEYLQWTEDMGLQNVLAIWDGHALDGSSVTGDALDPYVDDVMNELEFLLGDTTTTFGALRAQYGREDPYTVNMIEVGNEDNLSGGCATYAERFTAFYNAIKAQYPDMTIIASTTNSSCLPDPLPSGIWQDQHYYLEPDQFVAQFNEWDNWSRDQPIFVGEYASTTNNQGQQTYWTDMTGSCSEAVYMIGMERNSDVVKMASFAPLLEHFDRAEWSPDLFGFDSSPGSLTGSTSYYVQKMFASNRGDTIKPVTADVGFGPLYWVASSTSSGTYYVKMANYGNSTESVTVKVPGASVWSASLQLLAGDPTTSNYPHDVTTTTQTSSISGSADDGYTVSLPEYAVAVLVLSP